LADWQPFPSFPGFTLRTDDPGTSHAPATTIAALSNSQNTEIPTFWKTRAHVPPLLVQANNIAALFNTVNYFEAYRDEPFFWGLVARNSPSPYCTADDAQRIVKAYEAARSESLRVDADAPETRLTSHVDAARLIPVRSPRYAVGHTPSEVKEREAEWKLRLSANVNRDLVTADFEWADGSRDTMAVSVLFDHNRSRLLADITSFSRVQLPVRSRTTCRVQTWRNPHPAKTISLVWPVARMSSPPCGELDPRVTRTNLSRPRRDLG
jgi:hypothetical protein